MSIKTLHVYPPMIDGYYWFTAERSSKPHIAEYIAPHWYAFNEHGPISSDEMKRRGYRLENRVEVPYEIMAKVGR